VLIVLHFKTFWLVHQVGFNSSQRGQDFTVRARSAS
jgi:hypothetical protein